MNNNCNLASLDLKLKNFANPEKSRQLQKFFKIEQGEYSYNDVFIGIPVPLLRQLAKNYFELSLAELQELLNSKIHEKRMVALLILIEKYKQAEKTERQQIFKFYLKNTKNINNWDLVDMSCVKIVGNFLLDKDKKSLYKLAKSKHLWSRRISIVSTYEFIKHGDFSDALKLSKILLKDKHDLIHKATGWMLREIGKRDLCVEEKFLKEHYKQISRTTLRYAIEHFEEEKRQKYLKGEI